MSAPHPPNAALVLYRPLVEKLVAALGALVTHQVAYLVAPLIGLTATAQADHGHLSLQWALVAPVAVGAAALFVVWQLRSLGFRSVISARNLGGLVIAFFLLQEVAEAIASGIPAGQFAANPAIATGVIVAPLVAWLLSRLLAGVTELAARLLSSPGVRFPASQPRLVPLPVRYRATVRRSPSRPRAPPPSLRN